MLARVHHFLHRERADFFGQLGGCAVAEGLHAFDEKGLAFGKGGRECVEKGGGERIAIVPPARGVMVRSAGVGTAFCTAISVSILTGAFTSCPFAHGEDFAVQGL